MTGKPRVGISTCLLGENVRYDGGHKLDRYLRDLLGRYVEFVPVCPEVECGMGVPREAVRLVAVDGDIRLVTQRTKVDKTGQMKQWMTGKLAELSSLALCGFIFKSQSPSSGLQGVKVYHPKGVAHDGVGLFARGVTGAFPLLPVEDDGRLNDDRIRENFIERIFIMQRWHELGRPPKSLKDIIDFHAAHKYTLMSHCPRTLKELGALLARGKQSAPDVLYAEYFGKFITALAKIATVKKNTNVLLHIMGYFKENLDPDEKSELKQLIDSYHAEQLPLIVPVTLINHYVRKYEPEYLAKQVYLNPHPLELMLRNHV